MDIRNSATTIKKMVHGDVAATLSGAAGEPSPASRAAASRRVLFVLAILALAAGGAMRVWAARGDLWLDEVWSLSLAEQSEHASEIFTRHHLDNNHYLITLWMYFLGSQASWFVYRIPSLIAGIGTILLAGRFARRWGFIESQTAIVLTSASYVLIVYASEARGYALAGFFALAAFLALDRYLEGRRLWAALGFSLAVVLGFLSHLTFAHFYLGAAVWSVVRTARQGPTAWVALRAVTACHLLPLVFLVTLYLTDVQYMAVGGGPTYSLEAVVSETLALSVGGASVEVLFGLAALTATVVTAGAAGIALASLWQARSDLWIFFGVAIFGSPLLLLIAHRPEYLHVRYFYINIVLLLVLCSYLLGRIYRSESGGPVLFAIAIALFIAGNVSNLYDFARFGRGQYLAAVQHMSEKSADGVLEVESDHDFRVGMLLPFYAAYLPPDQRIEFHLQSELRAKAPQWVILSSQAKHYVPPRVITDSRKVRYVRSGFFPYAGLSGFHWALYQRADVRQLPAR